MIIIEHEHKPKSVIGQEVEFAFPDRVRTMLKKRKRLKPSEHVEEFRYLRKSSIRGRWQNIITPYISEPFDLFSLPFVRELYWTKGPQMGLSEAIVNWFLYVIYNGMGDFLLTVPDRVTAREHSTDRFKPALLDAPGYDEFLTGNKDDISAAQIKLIHQDSYFAWASSVQQLASRPIPIVARDEVDKYDTSIKASEANTMDLLDMRYDAFPDSYKNLVLSTPTTPDGLIWGRYITEDSDVIGQYHIKCIHCARRSLFVPDMIKVKDGERDPKKIEQNGLAYVCCPKCGCIMDNEERTRAVERGKWFAYHYNEPTNENPIGSFTRDIKKRTLRQYVIQERTKRIGCVAPGFLSRFKSIHEMAATRIKAESSERWFKVYQNKWLALPSYVRHKSDRKRSALLSLQDIGRKRGIVPDKTAFLVAGGDTHKRDFHVSVWAVSFAEINTTGILSNTYSVVDFMIVPDFRELSSFCFSSGFKDVNGLVYPVMSLFLDAMGKRTSEVMAFASVNPSVNGIQGRTRMAQKLTFAKNGKYGKPLIQVNVNHYKDVIDSKLRISADDFGGIRLFDGTPDNQDDQRNENDEFIVHLSAERRNIKGIWEQVGSRPNHFLDTTCYAFAAADQLNPLAWVEQTSDVEEEKQGAVELKFM